MDDKIHNREIAEKIASVPFWRQEYFPKYFSEQFTMDFPSAPPGMPNHYDVWEAERCFEWLNRTIRAGTADWKNFMRRLIVSNSGQSDIAVQRFTGANRKGIMNPNLSCVWK